MYRTTGRKSSCFLVPLVASPALGMGAQRLIHSPLVLLGLGRNSRPGWRNGRTRVHRVWLHPLSHPPLLYKLALEAPSLADELSAAYRCASVRSRMRRLSLSPAERHLVTSPLRRVSPKRAAAALDRNRAFARGFIATPRGVTRCHPTEEATRSGRIVRSSLRPNLSHLVGHGLTGRLFAPRPRMG